MKLFGFDIKRVSNRKSAAYPSAHMTRLTEDFPILTLSADGASRFNLHNLRNRSQQLEREKGGIGERYFSCVETNVIGPDGIPLQLRIKNDAGEFDRAGSEEIEEAWEDFGCRGEFDVTGEHSSQNFDRVSIRASARDGDALQLVYRGAPNQSKIAFQLLEGQYLDDLHNVAQLANGNQIRMGVELDQYKRKVAFWILARHPGDLEAGPGEIYDGRRRRVPAFGQEPESPVHAIHVARTKRPEETRPVPWITPAMDPINMLAGYEEAELVAARAQACKHVFFERQAFAPDGTALDYGQEMGGQITDDMEPGGTTDLPIGVKANAYNPTHPNQAFAEFTKDFRRKISAALNCSYNTLFTDLEGVNYSSIRAGLIDERDNWKMTQNWYITAAKQVQFEAWLQMQLMMGAFSSFRMTDFDRIRRGTIWKPRRWQWVDPLKDVEASIAAIEAKLSTRSRIIADQSNEDFEDTIDEWAEEKAYITSKGLDPSIVESPQFADPAFMSGDPGDPIILGKQPALAAQTPNAPAAAPAKPQHHSASQERHSSGRFGAKRFDHEQEHEQEKQIINVNVAAPAKRSFTFKRANGEMVTGEIGETIAIGGATAK
jgi:lambda family phage portal protein